MVYRSLFMECRVVFLNVFRSGNCPSDSEAHRGVDVGLF